jgi:hypothetical protein
VNAQRLELLLVAQQALRSKDAKANRHHLFEIERAIDEIQGGCPNSHTDCVERWCRELVLGAAS